jgi:lipopolysaccharide biosynthesis glycosyltransferase
MFSPLGLLADPGSDAPTGTEVGSPMENETLKASSAGNFGDAPYANAVAGKLESVTMAASSATEECAKNIIPIILSADNNFAPLMYITMFSILKNANENTFCDFYLLIHPNFEQRYKDEITKLGEKYNNCKITFIDMGTAFTDVIPGGYPAAAYYRLATANLLPNYTKCLYLDVDILVLHDLGDLYNIDIDSCYIAGMKDMGIADSEWFSQWFSHYIKFDLQIPDPYQYINSGVLLMNLDLIRKDGLTEKLTSVAKHGIDGQRPFSFADQDVWNKVCLGRIKFLDPEWNVFSHLLLILEKSQEYYKKAGIIFGKKQFEKACINPCIVHFAGPKPWANPSQPYADEWWEYARQTPFYGELSAKIQPKQTSKGPLKRILHRRYPVQGQREQNAAKQRQSTAKAKIIGKTNPRRPSPHHQKLHSTAPQH